MAAKGDIDLEQVNARTAGLTREQMKLALSMDIGHFRYAFAIFKGANKAAAFRYAGYKTKSKAQVYRDCITIETDSKVPELIESLKIEYIRDTLITREQSMQAIEEIADDETSSKSIKLKAHKQLSDMQGWDMPTRTEITGKDGGPIKTKVIAGKEMKEAFQAIMDKLDG